MGGQPPNPPGPFRQERVNMQRVILDEVDSTNAEAARRAPSGWQGWILGLRQTRGRGRGGKPWQDPTGNFAGTHLSYPDAAPDMVALRSFAAALALADALEAAGAHPDQISLKWPNDVLLEGGKVAGILLESAGQGTRIDWLAVGIGVNLAYAPEVPGAAFAPVSLKTVTGRGIAPEAFLDHLAPAYDLWLDLLGARGFAPLRQAWLCRAARLGETIIARTPRETIQGRFDTVDETGNLRLSTTEGPRVITAADVFFQ